MDELGVLIAGHAKNAYWYGSQLTIEESRRVAPHNNATSLQVGNTGAPHSRGEGQTRRCSLCVILNAVAPHGQSSLSLTRRSLAR